MEVETTSSKDNKQRRPTMSKYNQGGMMEGLGGPVQMDPYNLGGIDPALEDCCRREVSENRRSSDFSNDGFTVVVVVIVVVSIAPLTN
jgi:hypothetical protein